MKNGSNDSGTSVEKGFDDSELADIMSEIENLEKEYSADTSSASDKIESSISTDNNQEQNSEDVDFSKGLDDLKLLEEETVQLAPHHEAELISDLEISEPVANLHVEKPKLEKAHSQDDQHLEDHTVRAIRSIQMDPVVKNKNNNFESQHNHDSHHLKNDEHKRSSHHNEKVGQHLSQRHDVNSTSLNFHIEGQMKMDLGFHINDEKINLIIDHEGLKIQLSSGMSFHLPLKKAS
jgi:hypothetical protein